MEYTKGPWRIASYGTSILSEDTVIADKPHDKIVPDSNWEANAQLISASPQLYEALKVALKVYEYAKANHEDDLFEIWLNSPNEPAITPIFLIIQALNKAEGKEVKLCEACRKRPCDGDSPLCEHCETDGFHLVCDVCGAWTTLHNNELPEGWDWDNCTCPKHSEGKEA